MARSVAYMFICVYVSTVSAKRNHGIGLVMPIISANIFNQHPPPPGSSSVAPPPRHPSGCGGKLRVEPGPARCGGLSHDKGL